MNISSCICRREAGQPVEKRILLELLNMKSKETRRNILGVIFRLFWYPRR